MRKHQEGFHWDCCCPHGNFVLFFCSVAFSWSSMFSGSIVSHVPQSHCGLGWYWPLGHSFCRAFTLSKPRGRTSAAVHSTLLYWGKVILTDTLIKLLCNTWIKQNHKHTINRAAAHNTSGWDITADCGCCLYNMKVFGWFMSLSLRVGRSRTAWRLVSLSDTCGYSCIFVVRWSTRLISSSLEISNEFL